MGRTAAEEYTIPGTQTKIPVGMRVIISALGLHHDPQYYPNPEVFDPERFSAEAIRQRPKMVYLPFGDGPRNCIGKITADVACLNKCKMSSTIQTSPIFSVPSTEK